MSVMVSNANRGLTSNHWRKFQYGRAERTGAPGGCWNMECNSYLTWGASETLSIFIVLLKVLTISF